MTIEIKHNIGDRLLFLMGNEWVCKEVRQIVAHVGTSGITVRYMFEFDLIRDSKDVFSNHEDAIQSAKDKILNAKP